MVAQRDLVQIEDTLDGNDDKYLLDNDRYLLVRSGVMAYSKSLSNQSI